MLDVKPIGNLGAGSTQHKCESEHFSFITHAIMRVDLKPPEREPLSFLLCRNCAINLAAMLQEQVRNIDNAKV